MNEEGFKVSVRPILVLTCFILFLLKTIDCVYYTIFLLLYIYIYIYLARTPEIGQGLGRILSCGARKPEQTYMDLLIIVDAEPPPFFMTY